jgi:F0F1-type ATP synthase membrane subunit a
MTAEAVAHGHGMNPLFASVLALPLYLWNFAPHPFAPQHGQSPVLWLMDVPLWAFLLVLELIGAVIKPFALMIRLFANMIAGHLVLAVLIGFIATMPTVLGQVGISLPVIPLVLLIRLLELFVAFLQAYIFTFLATLFIAAAVAPEH